MPPLYPVTGITAQRAKEQNLFFALLPDKDSARRLESLAGDLRRKHYLFNPPQPTSRFHVSLYNVSVCLTAPPECLESARQAASFAAYKTPPFQITLDRALSYSRRADTKAYVLRSSQRIRELDRLHSNLGAALGENRFDYTGRESFDPHVTLIYDEDSVAEHAIEPFGWWVGGFALVRRCRGQIDYSIDGYWELEGFEAEFPEAIPPYNNEPDHVRHANAKQAEIIRLLQPGQRLTQSVAMNRRMRELLASGFRQRNPAWTEEQVSRAVTDRILHARTG